MLRNILTKNLSTQSDYSYKKILIDKLLIFVHNFVSENIYFNDVKDFIYKREIGSKIKKNWKLRFLSYDDSTKRNIIKKVVDLIYYNPINNYKYYIEHDLFNLITNQSIHKKVFFKILCKYV